MNDFSRLEATSHMLQWLADDYETAIHEEVERILSSQVPDSELQEFIVSSDPHWLTGAVPCDNKPNKVIVVRSGLAFEFTLRVSHPSGESHELMGTFSWVAVHLNDPENVQHRIWLDIDGKLDEFGSTGELKQRMYFA